MAHYCICSVCGVKFDRDRIQAVKSGGRRYAHYTCKPDGEIVPLPANQIDEDMVKLMDYIKKIYGDKANWALIKKQIKDYTTIDGYSTSGILKSLVYFYDVKKNNIEASVEKSNGGIGIVKYCYKDAYNYYYDLFIANNINKDKDIQEITSKVREITIKPPERPAQKRFFKFLDDEVDDE